MAAAGASAGSARAGRSKPRVARDHRMSVAVLSGDVVPPADVILEEPPASGLPFLFLGGAQNADALSSLEAFRISHVLNVTTDPELGRHEGINTLQLALRDQEDENIAALFPTAFDFIEACKAAGGRVLVHCMAGRSRSATVVIWYLMKSRGMSLHDAFFHTKRARPCAFPNAGFWFQLQGEELKLRGEASETPEFYKKLLAGGLHDLRASPERFFRLYCTSFLNLGPSSAGCSSVVSDWPAGMSGGGSVEAVLESCLEHLGGHGARRAAVHFVKALLEAGKLTAAEVAEGFEQLVQRADLDEWRLDMPKINDYLLEVYAEAAQEHLISAAVHDRARRAVRGEGKTEEEAAAAS